MVFRDELIKLQKEKCNIWLVDSTCQEGKHFDGKVLKVGEDCVIIDVVGFGKKLYNLNQLVSVQKG